MNRIARDGSVLQTGLNVLTRCNVYPKIRYSPAADGSGHCPWGGFNDGRISPSQLRPTLVPLNNTEGLSKSTSTDVRE